jgi:hypothetical protein
LLLLGLLERVRVTEVVRETVTVVVREGERFAVAERVIVTVVVVVVVEVAFLEGGVTGAEREDVHVTEFVTEPERVRETLTVPEPERELVGLISERVARAEAEGEFVPEPERELVGLISERVARAEAEGEFVPERERVTEDVTVRVTEFVALMLRVRLLVTVIEARADVVGAQLGMMGAADGEAARGCEPAVMAHVKP